MSSTPNPRSLVDLIGGVLSLLLLIGVARSCRADSLIYMRIDPAVLETRVQVAPPTPQERLRTLRAQFRSAGCGDQLQEQPVPGAELPNLICTLPGSEAGIIVVAARLDYKSHGDEERVDWATVELLPLLAESLNSALHRQTLVFAAFTGHEQHHFAGSSLYLKQLTEAQRNSLRGLIFLYHLGRVPPAYAYPRPDQSRLAEVGRRNGFKEDAYDPNALVLNTGPAARALKLAEPSEISPNAASDTGNFANLGVLAINFHSLAYAAVPGIGGTITHISRTRLDPAVYNDTYNLLCVYVLLVDKALTAGP